MQGERRNEELGENWGYYIFLGVSGYSVLPDRQLTRRPIRTVGSAINPPDQGMYAVNAVELGDGFP